MKTIQPTFMDQLICFLPVMEKHAPGFPRYAPERAETDNESGYEDGSYLN